MSPTVLRPVLLGLAAVAALAVTLGVAVDAWRPAVAGLALLQLVTAALVLRGRRTPPAAVDRSALDAVRRLDERVQAMDRRLVLETQALRGLLEDRAPGTDG